MEAVTRRRSPDEIKAMLREAGYKGERIVLMHPTDQSFYNAMASVAVDAFAKVGLNIDDQAMDWGTVVQRRASMEPLDKGGWSVFPSGLPAPEYRDPLFAANLRGNGRAAWFGWPDDPEMEAMRDRWIDSTDEAERKRLDRQIQARAFETVPFIPLGQYLPPSAWRSNLKGILKGPVPVFWNVSKG
jgi:peptide/nickel transport system substrate-binding protein